MAPRVLRLTIAVAITMLLTANSGISSPASGIVEGQLKVVSEGGASRDGVSATENKVPCVECQLVILGKDDRQEVGGVTTDNDGRFRLDLPAGDYVLELKRQGRARLRAPSKTFTVTAGKTVHVDLEVERTVQPMRARGADASSSPR